MKCLPALFFLLAFPAFADTPPPDITLLDSWAQHRDWIVALSILLSLLTVSLVRLGWQRRMLRLAEQQFRQEKQHLADVIWGTDVGTWEWNVQSGDA